MNAFEPFHVYDFVVEFESRDKLFEVLKEVVDQVVGPPNGVLLLLLHVELALAGFEQLLVDSF